MAADASAAASLVVLHSQGGHASPAMLVGGGKRKQHPHPRSRLRPLRGGQPTRRTRACVREDLLGHDSGLAAENNRTRRERERECVCVRAGEPACAAVRRPPLRRAWLSPRRSGARRRLCCRMQLARHSRRRHKRPRLQHRATHIGIQAIERHHTWNCCKIEPLLFPSIQQWPLQQPCPAP